MKETGNRTGRARTGERVNAILDVRRELRTVPVEQVFITAMTCRYQFTCEELRGLRLMVEQELQKQKGGE